MKKDGPDGLSGAMAEDRLDQERLSVSDIAAGANEHDRNDSEDRPERGGPPGRSGPPVLPYGRSPGRRSGGLKLYKAGQGYHTRLWTAVGGAALILWGGAALYDQLSSLIDPNKPYYLGVTYGAAAAFVVGMGVLLYWIVGLSRGCNDFFIQTEGEMKKVSWSSRKEVVRSTKVVVVTVAMLGAMLFVVDLAFMWFFHLLGVLKAFPGFAKIFGLES
jgi:preprotein translocase subunit SecE